MKKSPQYKSEVIERLRKRIPLETRIRVRLEMEWLTDNIFPDRPATDEEIEKACNWSKKMTKIILKEIDEFKKDNLC